MEEPQVEVKSTMDEEHHKLNTKWVLWAHLPHDTDWSLKSYKKIFKMY